MSEFELTPYEKLFYHVGKCGDYNVMSSIFIQNEQTDQLIDRSLFEKSLKFLQSRHPFLRAYVEYNSQNDKVYLKLFDKDVTDRIQIEYKDLTQVPYSKDILVKECEIFASKIFPFNDQDLSWRVQLVSFKQEEKIEYLINLVISFFLTDGFNITSLSIELLNIINSLLNNQECEEMKSVLEPVESLHYFSEKSNLIKKDHLEDLRKFIENGPKRFLFPKKLSAQNETGFKLEFLRLDKELSKKILTKTKENQARPNGYFHTIAFYALKDLYDELNLEFPKEALVDIAASLRVRYEPSLNFSSVRNHVCILNIPTEADKFGKFKDFWCDARYIHKIIQENVSLEKGLLFSVAYDHETLMEQNSLFRDANSIQDACEKVTNTVICDLALSNLGSFVNDRVNLDPSGPFSIKEFYCSDSLQTKPSVSPGLIQHIFYWKGEMMIQFGANKSKISSVYVNRYIQNFKNWIQKSLF